MYNRIYVPVDNSEHSNTAVQLSVALGKEFGSSLVGSHVYAAKLHDVRFKQMEFTLPDEYKEENELEKQRKIHDALIARGLKLISDCYLNNMDEVPFERRHSDGRNFECIVDDVTEVSADLVIMGALGQGAVKYSQAGSVCERVLRRTSVDTLIIRDPDTDGELTGDASIAVCLDGSQHSYDALRAACAMARISGGRGIHIVGVTTETYEKEILEAHLDLAKDFVARQELQATTTCLEGAPVETIVAWLGEHTPWMVVLGRHGIDAIVGEGGENLGSLVEALIRTAPCNVLVAAGTVEQAAARNGEAVPVGL